MTTAYYKGQEQAYTFYQLPKQLLKDKQYQAISLEARLLYCLFLDRMQLSQKNGWQDEAGQTYIIYTQNEIVEELGCSSRSAVRILKELEEANMVERKRQGMYRPTLIYVQPLRSGKGCQKETTEAPKGNNMRCQRETTEAPEGNNMRCQKEIAEVPNGNNMMCQKETTCSFQMAGYEAPNGNTSNNNINHTEYIKTEESENDFSKNRKAEAEEAPARNSNAKLSAYQEHQYNLEKTYAQKGAEAAKEIERQTWWPENFQELSLNQRAELWRQQRVTLVFFASGVVVLNFPRLAYLSVRVARKIQSRLARNEKSCAWGRSRTYAGLLRPWRCCFVMLSLSKHLPRDRTALSP